MVRGQRFRVPSVSLGLVVMLLQCLYALLPPDRVGRVPASRGRVHRMGGLPVDISPTRIPGCEGRTGQQGMGGGLGEVRSLQVVGGDGDGKRGMEVTGAQGCVPLVALVALVALVNLVEVGLFFLVQGCMMGEGRGCCRLVLREVHQRIAFIVTSGGCVRCRRDKGGWRWGNGGTHTTEERDREREREREKHRSYVNTQ